MTASRTQESTICAMCGAVVEAEASRCWLCEHDLRSGRVPPKRRVPATVAGPDTTSAWIMNLLIVGLVMIVGIGLMQIAPGLAVLYGVLVLPGLATMFVVALRRRQDGRPQGFFARVGTFFLGVAVALFGIGALGIAAFVALALFCFYAMATGQF
jgi:hypothetical protein